MRRELIVGATLGLLMVATPALAAPETGGDTPITETTSVDFTATSKLKDMPTPDLQSEIDKFTNPPQANEKSAISDDASKEPLIQGLDTKAQTSGKLVVSEDITSEVGVVGATWSAQDPQPQAALGRYEQNGAWSEWEGIGDGFETSKDNSERSTEPWFVTNATKVEVALIYQSDAQAKAAQPKLTVIDPGERRADAKAAAGVPPVSNAPVAPAVSSSTATKTNGTDTGKTQALRTVASPARIVPAVNRPLNLHSRAQWGADERLMTWHPRAGAVRGAVVHHTAGTNNYSQGQVAGIIRGIYWYHASKLQWGDIGYNVLVDKYGGAWQGRAGNFWAYNTIGAHAYGVNASTFGISVLGNYTDVQPSAQAMDTVARVVAFKLSVAQLNPNGWATMYSTYWSRNITIPVISGHRDSSPTGCPGNAFYRELPKLRLMTARYMPQFNEAIAAKYQAQLDANVPFFLGGQTRVETSIAIAKHVFPTAPDTIYVARGDKYADALSGGSLTDGPIVLLMGNKSALNSLRDYVRSSGAKRVIALGGTGVINNRDLAFIANGKPTGRLGGANRMDTSAQIALRAWSLNRSKFNTVYLSEQSLGIDALAGGSLTDGPVLLVKSSGPLSASVRNAIGMINPQRVVALGGPPVVSDAVLREAAQGRPTDRYWGQDRYATAIDISRHAFPNGNIQHVYFAPGLAPIDAIAGGVISDGQILLLPNPFAGAPDHVGAEVSRLGAKYATALGGAAVMPLNTTVFSALQYTRE